MAYPHIKLEYYTTDNIKLDPYINIDVAKIKLKVYYVVDVSTEYEVYATNNNLLIRKFNDNINIVAEDNYYYIYPKAVGEVDIEVVYSIDDGYSKNEVIKIYRQGDYPKIKLVPYLNDIQHPVFLDMENIKYELKIFLMFSSDDSIEIQADIDNLEIVIIDKNVNFKIESGKAYIYPIEKGTCQIGAYLNYSSRDLFVNADFLLYEKFFRNMYQHHLLNTYDMSNISDNLRLRVLFNVLMEFLDILYAYNSDLNGINSPFNIKARFLSLFGISQGFERDNLYDGTNLEYAYNQLYRELLINLLDLVQLRGTKLAYELFFSALGYDIEILEYWFNNDNHLVEFNYDNPEESTFHIYSEYGTPLEDIPIAHMDPRNDVDPFNEYNQANKSKYIRISLEPKDGVYNPTAFASQQRILINKYLDWLKPNHIEYLQEIFKRNISRTETEDGDELWELDDDDAEYPFSVMPLFFIPTFINSGQIDGVYIDVDGNYNAIEPSTEVPSNPGFPYWVPPPGLMDNVGNNYVGFWDPDTKGFCIEHLEKLREDFLLGDLLSFYEVMENPIRYDGIYHYDEATPESEGLYYDKGLFLNDDDLFVLNLNTFTSDYNTYSATHTLDETKEYLASLYNTTITQIENMIDLI